MKTCLTALLLAFAAPMVHAQETSEPVVLDTVVVSVQKRNENETTVPRAMTVQDRWQLAQAQVTSVDDLATLGPNMSSSQANGLNTFTLRGVGGGGRNIGFDPRVGVYIDGVYAGQAAGLSQPLFGVEQAVVLRGPQGALFGRNSVAGAIVLTSQQAPDSTQGEVKLGAGNHHSSQIEASVGGAFNDRLRGQIGVLREKRDGTTTNVFDGNKLDDRDRLSVRGQLAFDATENDEFKLFVDHSRIDEQNFVGAAYTTFFGIPLAPGAQRPNFNTTPSIEATFQGVSAHWNHKDGSGRTWTVIAGHRNTEQERRNDTDYSALDLVNVRYRDEFTINSLEARVANADTARSRYVAGVYIAREQADTLRRVDIGNDVASRIPVPGAPAGLPFGAVFGLTTGLGALSTGQVDSNLGAVFGQWDFDITDRWTSHVGGRFSRETKTVDYQLDGRNSGRMAIATFDYNDRRAENHFAPTGGVSFKINDNHTAYATYSQGHKSGGWNLDFLNTAQAASGFSFDDESVDNLEVGVKGQVGRWSYDVAAFDARIDDYQVFQFEALGGGGSVSVLRNAASARSRGVEAQGRFKVSQHLSFHGAYGVLDATFKDFPGGGAGNVNLRGNDLPEAPRHTASVGSRVTWNATHGQWSVDAQAAYRGLSYAGVENLASERLEARTIVDAQIGFAHRSGIWDARLWARNLTNSDADAYRTRDFFGHQVRKSIEPRMVGVEVALRF
jgi:iron complex outermembrane receptor protein